MKWSVSMHELQSNVMNCIFIALFQVLKALYNGSFIHTLGGEAANSRRQRPHFPHSHTNGGKLTPTNSLEAMWGSVSCPRTLGHVDRRSRDSNHRPMDHWTT